MSFNIVSLEKKHLKFLNEVRNTYCEEFLHDSRKFTIEDTIDWFNKNKPEYYVVENNDSELIGYFRTDSYSEDDQSLNVGFDIHPKFRGAGLSYKIYCKFLSEIFVKKNLQKVKLEVLETNEVAINLYNKLGFQKDEENIYIFLKNGKKIKSIPMYLNYENFFEKNVRMCLIIVFYFGDRRKPNDIYRDSDRLCLLKRQIEYLEKVPNNLTEVIFNFNVDKIHYELLNDAIKLIPKEIRNTKITIQVRENTGLSYGAWDYTVKKRINDFDYFIFNEDDYFFIQPNWNEYLFKKFHRFESCGYLGMAVRPDDRKNKKKHTVAFHSVGMTSSENLISLLGKKNSLITYKNAKTYSIGVTEQNNWTRQFTKINKKNYDIRSDFAVEFGLTDRSENIWRLWWWNEKLFISNSISEFNSGYVWWDCYDLQYQDGFLENFYNS